MTPKPTPLSNYEILLSDLRKFVAVRNWGQFHTAKNLAVSISIESAELLEHFQWSEHQSPDREEVSEIQDEVADVLLYLMLLSDKLGFNLLEAGSQKLSKNITKYPVERCRGSSLKYDKLKDDSEHG